MVGKFFCVNSGVDVSGCVFDLQYLIVYEVGFKLQIMDECLGVNFVVYDIIKINVFIVSDMFGFQVVVGEVKSIGFEVDVYGQIDVYWCFLVNFVWDNVCVIKDKILVVGMCLVNILVYSVGFLVMCEDVMVNGVCYGLGGGVNYVGNCLGNIVDMYLLLVYVMVKFLSYWQVSKNVWLLLDVYNFFNCNYYFGLWNNFYVMLGVECMVVVCMKIDL